MEEETKDKPICLISDEDEDEPFREGESVVGQWSF